MAQKPLSRQPTWQAIISAAVHGCGFIMTGHGTFTLVDEDVMESLGVFCWRQANNGYVKRHSGPAKNRRVEYIHRIIACAPDDVEIDHKNRIRSDNRRLNLRVCTLLQNKGNIGRHSDHRTSKFKGVRKRESRRKWDARASFNNKTIYLGTFNTEGEAARAYDEWAKARWGEFANLNFP